MPVDHRTVQPYGLLHGGASAVLAETLGSIAGGMQVNLETQSVVGVEINCNHLRSARDGWVYGIATPVKIGRKIHVWNIEIKNEDDKLVAVSRLTLAVINKK
jgi:1,4-dihydroxy-2-naphthoyl-CoA hydrolase